MQILERCEAGVEQARLHRQRSSGIASCLQVTLIYPSSRFDIDHSTLSPESTSSTEILDAESQQEFVLAADRFMSF